eukprot:1547783-Pyramimonas_sp.AAC.1
MGLRIHRRDVPRQADAEKVLDVDPIRDDLLADLPQLPGHQVPSQRHREVHVRSHQILNLLL